VTGVALSAVLDVELVEVFKLGGHRDLAARERIEHRHQYCEPHLVVLPELVALSLPQLSPKKSKNFISY
jgi:hypothetical protein